MKLAKSLLAIMLLSVLLTACGQAAPTPEATPIPTVMADTAIISEGRLEPIRYADIALSASGLVSEVLVTEGQTVEAGEVIARLESDQVKTLDTAMAETTQELTAAYQGVRDAQFKLDNFDIPKDFSGMTPPQAVEEMLVRLNTARENFEPYKDMDERNLEPTDSEKESGNYVGTGKRYKRQLDDAWAKYRKAILWLELESNVVTAEARLARAQKDLAALQDPSFSEITAGTRASLATAEVRAPFGGVITSLDLKAGEFASSGQPVYTLADLSSWVVKTTDLTEIDVVELEEGQIVTVTLDALPGVELNGNVLSIGQSYSENQGDIVYEVAVLLTENNPAMRWGMTAEVTFE